MGSEYIASNGSTETNETNARSSLRGRAVTVMMTDPHSYA